MHYLVRFIVEADYAHQATSKVIDTLDNLVEMHEFDWYHDTAERSRWKGCWKPTRLNTKKGQRIAHDAMNGQFMEFKRALATIRLMLDGYTDEHQEKQRDNRADCDDQVTDHNDSTFRDGFSIAQKKPP
jgi:hypothetical protein